MFWFTCSIKDLAKEVSEINLVIKAKLTKVQFPQWGELMATALLTAMSPVEGARETVAAWRSCFAFLLLAGQSCWGKPSQEGELGFCDSPLRQLRGSRQFCSPVSFFNCEMKNPHYNACTEQQCCPLQKGPLPEIWKLAQSPLRLWTLWVWHSTGLCGRGRAAVVHSDSFQPSVHSGEKEKSCG